MELNVEKELAALKRLTVNELRARYTEVFAEATNARHKPWLVRRIIWRMQAIAEGDLSERARQRATELANDADLRLSPPKAKATTVGAGMRTQTVTVQIKGDERLPLPGSTIKREYKGEVLEVRVLPRGFEFEGEVYKSLSAVAKKITGQHCNGFHFFRLTQEGGKR